MEIVGIYLGQKWRLTGDQRSGLTLDLKIGDSFWKFQIDISWIFNVERLERNTIKSNTMGILISILLRIIREYS